jgi:subfamily B ATP-binding cassette protein MsbA
MSTRGQPSEHLKGWTACDAGQRRMQPDLWAFFSLLDGARRRLLGVLACLALAAATEPAMVAVIKYTVDWGNARIQVPRWLGYPMLPAAILLLYVVRGGAAAGAAHWMGGVCADTVTALQRQTLRRVLKVRGWTAMHMPIGIPVHLLTFEIKQCADLLERIATKLVRHVLTLVALYGSLFILNWKLTLLATLAIPLLCAVCWLLLGQLRRLTTSQIALNEGLADLLIERSHKATLVKLHGAVELELADFQQAADQLRKSNLSLYSTSAVAAPLTQVIAAVIVALIMTWVVQANSDGSMTKGDAVAYITNLLLVLTPLKNLAELNGPVIRSIVGMQSVLALRDLPVESECSAMRQRVTGEIELTNVTVVYPQASVPALEDFSARIAAGEMVALTGPSGVGKSTVFQVIRGLVDPVKGEVKIDGRPLSAWPRADLRLEFAVVTQRPQLFNRSILENIAYGEACPDHARAWRALVDVGLDAAVAALPMGINSQIGIEGVLLSGGQARLLAIARALYSRAPVILLDEPTASLDLATRRKVQASLTHLRRDRTILLITHDPSLAACADRVIAVSPAEAVR